MMKSTLLELQTLTEKLAQKLSEPHDAGLDERVVALLQKAIKEVFDFEINRISEFQLELVAAHAKIKSLEIELDTTKAEVVKLQEALSGR